MQLKEKDTKKESRMQNNEAINKGIESEKRKARDSVSRSLTRMHTKKCATTMDHNNILNNAIDCHPHVEWKKEYQKKTTYTFHAPSSNEKKNWFENLTAREKKFSVDKLYLKNVKQERAREWEIVKTVVENLIMQIMFYLLFPGNLHVARLVQAKIEQKERKRCMR